MVLYGYRDTQSEILDRNGNTPFSVGPRWILPWVFLLNVIVWLPDDLPSVILYHTAALAILPEERGMSFSAIKYLITIDLYDDYVAPDGYYRGTIYVCDSKGCEAHDVGLRPYLFVTTYPMKVCEWLSFVKTSKI